MGVVFLVLAIVCIVLYFAFHRSADKLDAQFANRPATIVNPANDLFQNQKYAIVGLLAIVQGASPQSAFNEAVNQMVQSTISSLGLSKQEVERYLKVSMNHDVEREIDRIIYSLKEIRDRSYLASLYQKCLQIAKISGDYDTIEGTKEIFKELGF